MRFNALVDRFSYIIRGQFFGHSHVDHVAFYPSFKDKGKLSGYYFISPSITTATYKNPQYRIMDVDYDTLQVTEYYQYMYLFKWFRLNLSSNPKKEDNPKFELFYTFKDSYKIKDITVQGGMTELYEKLRDDPEYQKLYSYLMDGGLHEGKTGKSVFCDTTTSPQFKSECEGHKGKKTSKSIFDKIAGPWKDLKHKWFNFHF